MHQPNLSTQFAGCGKQFLYDRIVDRRSGRADHVDPDL